MFIQYRPVRYSVAALQRNMEERQQLHLLKAAHSEQQAAFEKVLYTHYEELKRSETVENVHIQQLEELKR